MTADQQSGHLARRVFRLPDAGEGLTEAEIVTWRVRPGDVVAVNDPLVEIETAKSLVELPSPFAGAIAELLVPEGTTVAVGTPIVTVADLDPPAPLESPAPVSNRTPVLVGYGPRSATTSRRRRPVTAPPEAPADPRPAGAAGRALAKPPVRRLARDLGVDLQSVSPTGPGGVVTRADVERAGSAPATPAPATPVPVAPSRDGETRIPVKGVRKATAAAMVASAFTAPHVTEWVEVDVSRSVRLVQRLRTERGFEDVKVSPLLLVAKALLIAVRRHPEINARWDAVADEIVLKRDVNLGIAAATPRGLIVPNLKRADRMSLRDLAGALAELTSIAREGRTQPADLADGTITITNVGVFGVDGGTPIINPGQAAILAVGAIRQRPWVHKGKVKPRWVTTLSLSFDHRLVDGELGSSVLTDVAAILERPDRALLMS